MMEEKPPIRRVAVIGAGISGICSAAHLLKLGLEVQLFERSSVAGGVWHLDKRTAPEPDYAKQQPSLGDYARHIHPAGSYLTPPRTPPSSALPQQQLVSQDELEVAHAPPGPTYEGLKNNVALPLMKTTLADWPEGLDEYVNQHHLEEYIQNISHTTGVHHVTEYQTRVEKVTRPGLDGPWSIQTLRLTSAGLVEETWQFDAVVVASGHYNMPRIPAIPGLQDWKARYPDRIMHSKGYRNSRAFKHRRLLVVGAGASSLDIVKEAIPVAEAVYQSSRGGEMDVPRQMLPAAMSRVGGIKAFHLDDRYENDEEAQQEIRGYVEFVNGETLRVDNVVLATGYITSYPFLPQLHDDAKAGNEAGFDLLVTKEGDMAHNLYKDIFWISEPTLAFVGVPYHISTFSFFEFQAQIVARVFAGLAKLPPEAEMRKAYLKRLSTRGPGRDFHSMRAEGEELEYVAELVDWANRDAPITGAPRMLGHTDAFLEGHRQQREMLERLGLRFERRDG